MTLKCRVVEITKFSKIAVQIRICVFYIMALNDRHFQNVKAKRLKFSSKKLWDFRLSEDAGRSEFYVSNDQNDNSIIIINTCKWGTLTLYYSNKLLLKRIQTCSNVLKHTQIYQTNYYSNTQVITCWFFCKTCI